MAAFTAIERYVIDAVEDKPGELDRLALVEQLTNIHQIEREDAEAIVCDLIACNVIVRSQHSGYVSSTSAIKNNTAPPSRPAAQA